MKHKHLYLESNLAHSMRLPKNKIASEAQEKKRLNIKIFRALDILKNHNISTDYRNHTFHVYSPKR